VAYTADQILQTAYHAISTSGIYTNACKEWCKIAIINKTRANFKQFFAAKYHDIKEQQKVNSSHSNFHSTNAAVDTGQALDNLATAATADRDIIAQLTTSNLQLTTTNKLLTEQLKLVLTMIASHQTNTSAATPPRCNGMTRAEGTASLNPKGYCWSHGYKLSRDTSVAPALGSQ